MIFPDLWDCLVIFFRYFFKFVVHVKIVPLIKTNRQQIDLSDVKQFKTGYESHFSALKYFALRYVEDEEVVCDLLQDLFVKVWEKGEKFENELVFTTYLYRAVRNNCLCYIRDARRKEARMAGYEPEETEESFVNQMIEAEVYALINEIFDELPEASRQVYLRSLEGKSHQEISEELHIAINTIKKHKNNANHYLRARLEKLVSFLIYIG